MHQYYWQSKQFSLAVSEFPSFSHCMHSFIVYIIQFVERLLFMRGVIIYMYWIKTLELYIESKVHHYCFIGYRKGQFLLFGHVAINKSAKQTFLNVKCCWLCVQNIWIPKASNSAFDWHNGVQQDFKYQIISYSWFNTVKNTTNWKTAN